MSNFREKIPELLAHPVYIFLHLLEKPLRTQVRSNGGELDVHVEPGNCTSYPANVVPVHFMTKELNDKGSVQR